MDFRILGPLEVLDGDRPVPLPGQRQRSLLALPPPPRQPGRLVGQADRRALARRGAGVRARRRCRRASRGSARHSAPAPRCSSPSRPATCFGSTASSSTSAASSGSSRTLPAADPAAAAELLREALGLWRGPALADLAFEPFAQAAIARLEDLHLLAIERRIDADLALGQHATARPGARGARRRASPARGPPGAAHARALPRRPPGGGARALPARQADAGRRARDRPEPRAAGARAGHPATGPRARARAARAPAALDPAVGFSDAALEPLLALAEPLARKPEREVIVARVVQDRAALGGAAAALNVHCASLAERGVEARAAAFVSTSAGADTSRLATEQDVDLILVSAGPALLDDPDLGELLRTAPCDVGVVVGDGPRAGPRPRARSPAPSTTGARSSSAPGSPAAGRCRSGSRARSRGRPRLEPPARERLARSSACARSRGGAAPPGGRPLGARRRLTRRRDRRRRPLRPLAQGRPRTDAQRARSHGPAGAPRAQGPPAGRARAGREPDALHLVDPGLISAPTAAVSASRRPASSRSAAGRVGLK